MNRRIILDLAVTLDGFIEGSNGEVDWCVMDPEMGFTQFLNQIDTIFMEGKATIYGDNIHRNLKMKRRIVKFGI